MKSRVGRVDRGHKFGPGDFPDRTALAMRLPRAAMSPAYAVNVKMDSLIIRPKIARTTKTVVVVWSMILSTKNLT